MRRVVFVLLSSVSLGLLLGGALPWGWHREPMGMEKDDGTIRLEVPFALAWAAEVQPQPAGGQQNKGVNFLEQEAGIAAYVNLGQALDLDQARKAFKTVETDNDQYIIGEVALPKLPEAAHPHVYVNVDGWIVAYYSREEPASKLMPWVDLDGKVYKGGPLTTTTLENAIRLVVDALGFVYPKEVKYYSFEHPEATRITLAVEMIDLGREDSFYLTIPAELRVYEASWALVEWGNDSGDVLLEDRKLGGGNGFLYGSFTDLLKKGVRYRYRISITRNCAPNPGNDCNTAGAAIALIY